MKDVQKNSLKKLGFLALGFPVVLELLLLFGVALFVDALGVFCACTMSKPATINAVKVVLNILQIYFFFID